MHGNVMQQSGSNDHCSIRIAQQTRMAVGSAVVPDLLWNQFHLGLQDPVDVIGAVVGVQPFGGRGLSGTGPKAGGPITLFRFAEERVVSVNTAAAGGNAALLADDSA